jgi:hypothetical protein
MACLRPVPAASHTSPATFEHKDLEKCTHVFLRQDTMRRALEPPYSGPYQILSWRDKTLQLLVCRRPVTVSTDRVKPAYILNKTNCVNNLNPPAIATPAIVPPATPPQPPTKNYAHTFPLSLQHLSNHLHGGGGGVMWELPTATHKHRVCCCEVKTHSCSNR